MSDFDAWTLNPERIELGENEIHIWRAYLDCGDTALRQLEATLAPDETARANRFIFERDKNSFIVARGILRGLLGRYANRAPGDLEFDYSRSGKPSLRQGLSDLPIQFNISHSHGLALLTFAARRHLGVDVELIRPNASGEEIAKRFFSPQEIVELRALPSSLRSE
jgi:4'-phosphopantetheinyl transferase